VTPLKNPEVYLAALCASFLFVKESSLPTGAWYSTTCKYITIVAFSSLLLPRSPLSLAAIRVLDTFIFQHWKRQCSYKVTHDRTIAPDQQYIVAEFPHGVCSPLLPDLSCEVYLLGSVHSI
jgi:hypothetical protein